VVVGETVDEAVEERRALELRGVLPADELPVARTALLLPEADGLAHEGVIAEHLRLHPRRVAREVLFALVEERVLAARRRHPPRRLDGRGGPGRRVLNQDQGLGRPFVVEKADELIAEAALVRVNDAVGLEQAIDDEEERLAARLVEAGEELEAAEL